MDKRTDISQNGCNQTSGMYVYISMFVLKFCQYLSGTNTKYTELLQTHKWLAEHIWKLHWEEG